jgi:hypothetical protein
VSREPAGLLIEDMVRERESIRFAIPTVDVEGGAVGFDLDGETKLKSPERSLTTFFEGDPEGNSDCVNLSRSSCDLVGVRARYVISGFFARRAVCISAGGVLGLVECTSSKCGLGKEHKDCQVSARFMSRGIVAVPLGTTLNDLEPRAGVRILLLVAEKFK